MLVGQNVKVDLNVFVLLNDAVCFFINIYQHIRIICYNMFQQHFNFMYFYSERARFGIQKTIKL